jgi:3-hydroxyisobutyrate dehydrogenase
MARLGFIGLGNMGGPMALNLLKAGHEVTGFDVVQASLKTFAEAGGTTAGSLAEAASDKDAVLTMLPAGRQVRDVYGTAGGVLASARKGTLLIDCSTIDVETAREVARKAEEAGMTMVDAPVSGGVAGAAAATLTFMVGGPAEVFARAQPILAAMGKTIVHAGSAGTGQAAKICNNMILGVSMIGVCEAFVLAEKLGLDPQKLFDISSKASGQCWSLTSYCPVPGPVPTAPSNRGYKPGFTAAMMLKDLKLAQEAARVNGAATPMGAEAEKLYASFTDAGGEATDFSGIIEWLRGRKAQEK